MSVKLKINRVSNFSKILGKYNVEIQLIPEYSVRKYNFKKSCSFNVPF